MPEASAAGAKQSFKSLISIDELAAVLFYWLLNTLLALS